MAAKKGDIIIHFEPFVHQKPKVRFQAGAHFIFICTLPISQNHCLFCFAPILFVQFCSPLKGHHFKLHQCFVLQPFLLLFLFCNVHTKKCKFMSHFYQNHKSYSYVYQQPLILKCPLIFRQLASLQSF